MTGGAQDSGVLLACPNPWCEAQERDGDFRPQVHYSNFGLVYVACTSCTMAGPTRQHEHEAITAWNTRATRAPAGWQPISEAPEVNGKYFFCRVAWGPDWNRCTGDGFRWDGRWFVAAPFHNPGVRFDECQFEFRQIEVQPTHFMRRPEIPDVHQYRPHTGVHVSECGHNSELEPDGQDERNFQPDRQGREGGQGGRCAEVFAGCDQRGKCSVRFEDGEQNLTRVGPVHQKFSGPTAPAEGGV